jgi:hypothetical protein
MPGFSRECSGAESLIYLYDKQKQAGLFSIAKHLRTYTNNYIDQEGDTKRHNRRAHQAEGI